MEIVSHPATHGQSASAAQARASECEDRRVRLRSHDVGLYERDVTTDDDVTSAAARLASARERAAAALERLHRLQRARGDRRLRAAREELDACRLPLQLDEGVDMSDAAQRLCTAVRSGKLRTVDLWLDFCSYGGEAQMLEFDAYLHGAYVMSETDRTILAQVWWEHESLR